MREHLRRLIRKAGIQQTHGVFSAGLALGASPSTSGVFSCFRGALPASAKHHPPCNFKFKFKKTIYTHKKWTPTQVFARPEV